MNDDSVQFEKIFYLREVINSVYRIEENTIYEQECRMCVSMSLCVLFLGGCYHATFYSETSKWRNYSARLKSNTKKKMFQQNHIRRLLHHFESFFMVKREKEKKREKSLSKYVRTHTHIQRWNGRVSKISINSLTRHCSSHWVP